jgi:hypothetical protein
MADTIQRVFIPENTFGKIFVGGKPKRATRYYMGERTDVYIYAATTKEQPDFEIIVPENTSSPRSPKRLVVKLREPFLEAGVNTTNFGTRRDNLNIQLFANKLDLEDR